MRAATLIHAFLYSPIRPYMPRQAKHAKARIGSSGLG